MTAPFRISSPMTKAFRISSIDVCYDKATKEFTCDASQFFRPGPTPRKIEITNPKTGNIARYTLSYVGMIDNEVMSWTYHPTAGCPFAAKTAKLIIFNT